jgi:hypothetical protein
MNFESLVRFLGDEPIFETSVLLSGQANRADVQKQLSRWAGSGRLHQLRKGVYAFAPPYQKNKPHPFVVANALMRGSYVSGQSALAYYGLIPEHVAATTSVCSQRPAAWDTPLGRFEFRFVKRDWMKGYVRHEVAPNQFAFVAQPEKALLDLVHLQPGGDGPAFLSELRLQNLEKLNLQALAELAQASHKPKLIRAAGGIAELAEAESSYETI